MKPTKNLTLGSIYKTKTGLYRAAITIGYDGRGKQIRRTVSAKTEKECLRRRQDLYARLQRARTTPEDITLERWSEIWLSTIAFENYTPGNLRNHESCARRYIVPTLGQYKLSDLGAEEVMELDAATAHLSGSTRQGVRSSLSACLDAAVQQKRMEENPCSMVKRPRARFTPRSALSVDAARHLIVHAEQNGDPLATLWASFLFLGSRRNELLGLEWDRVDLDRGMIELSWAMAEVPWAHGKNCRCNPEVKGHKCPVRVHKIPQDFEAREMHGSLMWTRLKTFTSHRWTPMPPPLVNALRAQKQRQPVNQFGLVWTGEKGGPLRPDRALKRWKRALRAAGLPEVDIHTTRHTTASLLRECGVREEVIAMILGQAQIDTTRRYIHTFDGQASAAMAALTTLFALPGGVESAQEGDNFGE